MYGIKFCKDKMLTNELKILLFYIILRLTIKNFNKFKNMPSWTLLGAAFYLIFSTFLEKKFLLFIFLMLFSITSFLDLKIKKNNKQTFPLP